MSHTRHDDNQAGNGPRRTDPPSLTVTGAGTRGGRTVMSHAEKADKLLIKPAAGARPAPPCTRGQIIPKARTRRPVTR